MPVIIPVKTVAVNGIAYITLVAVVAKAVNGPVAVVKYKAIEVTIMIIIKKYCLC